MERTEKKTGGVGISGMVVAMLAVGFLGGCSSTPGKTTAPGDPVVPTDSKLVRGDTLKNFSPLPMVTPVKIHQNFSDGHQEVLSGYIEYDFNRDGRPDMLEIQTPDGQPSAYAYDFNLDGIIDGVERVPALQNKNHSPK